MFQVEWTDVAFDQMQRIITANPVRLPEIQRSLRSLFAILTHAADSWGESRRRRNRLGFVEALSALVEVDVDQRLVRIREVRIKPSRDAG